jgi:hypothetical protein
MPDESTIDYYLEGSELRLECSGEQFANLLQLLITEPSPFTDPINPSAIQSIEIINTAYLPAVADRGWRNRLSCLVCAVISTIFVLLIAVGLVQVWWWLTR